MYGKLFSQMYEGTLASRGPWQALVTFQQLIALANRHGEVDMTAEAISRRTTIPLEIIQMGLEELSKPDPESRTPDEDGKRIVLIDSHRSWGWRLVNYQKYRKIRSEDERREYQRQLMASRREMTKNKLASVSNVSPCSMQYAVSSKQKEEKEREEKTNYVATPQIVSRTNWLAFVEMRKKIRKPLTDRGANLIIKKLERLQAEGDNPDQVIEQSIMHDWAGVFELRKEKSNGKSFAEKRSEKSATAINTVLDRFEKAPRPIQRALPPTHN